MSAAAPTFEQKQVGRALLLLREAARLRDGGRAQAQELESEARSLLGAALHNWGFEAEDFAGPEAGIVSAAQSREEQEACHALQNARNAVIVADEKCQDAQYGSEILGALEQARVAIEYALAVAEGRT